MMTAHKDIFLGVSYSPDLEQFQRVLTTTFGGTITNGDKQFLWNLPGVGTWKVSYAQNPSAYIPLAVRFPIEDLERQLQTSTPEGIGFRIEGEKHWRVVHFFLGTDPLRLSFGAIHFANRN